MPIIQVANVYSSDTFNTWREKTNELINIVNQLPTIPIGSLDRVGGVIDGQTSLGVASPPEIAPGVLIVIPGPGDPSPSIGVGDFGLVAPFTPKAYTLQLNRSGVGQWANVELTADKTGISANGISITNGLLSINAHASDLIGSNSNDAVITIGGGLGAASRGTLGDPNIINLWDGDVNVPTINAFGFGVNDSTLGYTAYRTHGFFSKRSHGTAADVQRLLTINATGTFTYSNTFVLANENPATGDLYVQGNAHFGTSYTGVVVSNNMVQIDTLTDANPAIDLIPSLGHTNTTRDTDKIRIWSSGSDTMGFGISADSLDYVASANHVFHTGSTGALGENAVINSLGIFATTDITAGSDVIATGNVVATNVYVGASENVILSNRLIEINTASGEPGIAFNTQFDATLNTDKIRLWTAGGREYGFGMRQDTLDYMGNNHVFSDANPSTGPEWARINSTGIFSESNITSAGLFTGTSAILSGLLNVNSGQSVLGSQVDTDGSATSRSKLALQGGANVAAIVVDSPSTSVAINPNVLEILSSGTLANTHGIGRMGGVQTYHAANAHTFYIDAPSDESTRREVLSITHDAVTGNVFTQFTSNANFTGSVTFTGDVVELGQSTVDTITATDATGPSTFAHPVHVNSHVNAVSYLINGATTAGLEFLGSTTTGTNGTADRIDLWAGAGGGGTIGFGIWTGGSPSTRGITYRVPPNGNHAFYHDNVLTANIMSTGIETSGYVNAVGGFDTTGNIYSSGNPWFVGATNNISLGAGTITATSTGFVSGVRIHVTTQGANPIGMFIDSSGTGDTHTALIINSTSLMAIDLSAGGMTMKKGLTIDGSERITQAGKVNAASFELSAGGDITLGVGSSVNLHSTSSNLYVGGNAYFDSTTTNGIAIFSGLNRDVSATTSGLNLIDYNQGNGNENRYGLGLNLSVGSVEYYTTNQHSMWVDSAGKKEKFTVNTTGAYIHAGGASAGNLYCDNIIATGGITQTISSIFTDMHSEGLITSEGNLHIGVTAPGATNGKINAIASTGLLEATSILASTGIRVPDNGSILTGHYWSDAGNGKVILLHGQTNHQPTVLSALNSGGLPLGKVILSESNNADAIHIAGGINARRPYKANGVATIDPQATGKANLVNIESIDAQNIFMNGSLVIDTSKNIIAATIDSPGRIRGQKTTSTGISAPFYQSSAANITGYIAKATGNGFGHFAATGKGFVSDSTATNTFWASAGGMDAKKGYSANNILTIDPRTTGRANLNFIETVDAQLLRINGSDIITSAKDITNVNQIDAAGLITIAGNIQSTGGNILTVLGNVQSKTGYQANSVLTISPQATGKANLVNIESVSAQNFWVGAINVINSDLDGRLNNLSVLGTAVDGTIIAENSITIGQSGGAANPPAGTGGLFMGGTKLIDHNHNLAGITSITHTGTLTSSGAPIISTWATTAITNAISTVAGQIASGSTSDKALWAPEGGVTANGFFIADGTEIIDSTGMISPAGGLTVPGALLGSTTITSAGLLTAQASLQVTGGTLVVTSSSAAGSISSSIGGVTAKTGFWANSVQVVIPLSSAKSNLLNINNVATDSLSIDGASIISVGVASTSADIGNVRDFTSIGASATSIDASVGGVESKLGYQANSVSVISPTATAVDIQNIGNVGTQTITVGGNPFVTSGRNITAGTIGGSTITASSDLVTTSGAIKTGATTRISSAGAFTGTGLDVGATNIDVTGAVTIGDFSGIGDAPISITGASPHTAAVQVSHSLVTAAFSDAPPSPGARLSFVSSTNATGPSTFKSWAGGMSAKTGFSANNILTINPTVTGRANLEKIERINAVSIAMEGASTSNVIAVFSEGFGTSMANIRQIGGIQNADNSYQDIKIKGRAQNYGTQSMWIPAGSFFDQQGTAPGSFMQTNHQESIAVTHGGTLTAPHYGGPYSFRTWPPSAAVSWDPATFESVFYDLVFPTSWAGPGSNVSCIATYTIDQVPNFTITDQQVELMYTLHCVKNGDLTNAISGAANSEVMAEGACVQRLATSINGYGVPDTQYSGHDSHQSANCHITVPTRVASNTAIPLISSFPAAEQDPSQYRWIFRIHRRVIVDSIGNGNSPLPAGTPLEASGFGTSVATVQIKAGIKLIGVSVQYETTHLTDADLGDYADK